MAGKPREGKQAVRPAKAGRVKKAKKGIIPPPPVDEKLAPIQKELLRENPALIYQGVYTDEVVDAICVYIEKGFTNNMAAMAAGVSAGTFAHWLHKGRKGIKPYDVLFTKWAAALTRRRAYLLERILNSDSTADIRWYLMKSEKAFQDAQVAAQQVNIINQQVTSVDEAKDLLARRLDLGKKRANVLSADSVADSPGDNEI